MRLQKFLSNQKKVKKEEGRKLSLTEMAVIKSSALRDLSRYGISHFRAPSTGRVARLSLTLVSRVTRRLAPSLSLPRSIRPDLYLVTSFLRSKTTVGLKLKLTVTPVTV